MAFRDALPRKAKQPDQAPAPVATAAKAPTTAASSTPAAKTASVPVVTFKCGHTAALAHFKAEDCGACRGKARQKKAEARSLKRARELANANRDIRGRLPAGSVYHKTYDGERQEWTVTLTAPGVGEFTATGSGSFRTEVLVDRMYRDAAAAARTV